MEKEGNPEQAKFRRAVFIVVYRINPETKEITYLILNRKKHWKGWEFPKGGIDEGESLFQTAKRETFEESGIRPIKIRKFPISGKYIYQNKLKDRKGIIGQTYTLFSAQVLFNQETRIDKQEHSGYAWLSFEDAKAKLTHKNQKRCLNIVNRSLIKK